LFNFGSNDERDGLGKYLFKENYLTDNAKQSDDARQTFLGRGLSFLKRQERDWKVTVLRTSLDKLAFQMVETLHGWAGVNAK